MLNTKQKIVIKESKPVIYVSVYMLYSFVFGIVLMWAYINEMGGTMPAPGSLYLFLKIAYGWITSFGAAPVLFKIFTKYLENRKNKKLADQNKRRAGDR